MQHEVGIIRFLGIIHNPERGMTCGVLIDEDYRYLKKILQNKRIYRLRIYVSKKKFYDVDTVYELRKHLPWKGAMFFFIGRKICKKLGLRDKQFVWVEILE